MINQKFGLIKEIIELSASDKWDDAKSEWYIVGVSVDETCKSECLCGKKDIRNLNHIQNKINGNKTIVGSCCVEKFLGIPSKFLLLVIEHLKKSQITLLSSNYIAELCKQKFINECDVNFYLDIQDKLDICSKTIKISQSKLNMLSQKEILRLSYINMKILNMIDKFIDNDILIAIMQTYQENIRVGVTENCYMIYDIVKRFNILFEQKETLLLEHSSSTINKWDYKNNMKVALILNGCSHKYEIDYFFEFDKEFLFQINIDYNFIELKDYSFDKKVILNVSDYMWKYILNRGNDISSDNFCH